jgi:2-dehydro-3-deoxygalactonokinase
MSAAALIAIDWGTSAARAYRVDASGAVLDVRHAPLGITQVRAGAFAPALASLLGDWSTEPLPRLACGMIGSRQGWVEAPYLACPADFASLAGALARTPGGELSIVPGVTCRDEAGVLDVIRGEETQLAGAIDANEDRVLAVLPGTHSKWAWVANGRIVEFVTYMTGEVYAVLLAHSILGRMAGRAAAAPGAAFAKGVARGLESGGVLHQIFGARTLALAGELAGDDVPDWLSGVLIGAETRSARAWAQRFGDAGTHVRVIGGDALTGRYVAALEQAGFDAHRAPTDAAARGLAAIARRAHLID